MKKYKTLFLLFFMFLNLQFIGVLPALAQLDPNDPSLVDVSDDQIYIRSDDIIKNFKFETFNGIPVDSAGRAHNGKLNFQIGDWWRIQKDEIELVESYTTGQKIFFRYSIPMTNELGIYTAVPLADAHILGTGSFSPVQPKAAGLSKIREEEGDGSPGDPGNYILEQTSTTTKVAAFNFRWRTSVAGLTKFSDSGSLTFNHRNYANIIAHNKLHHLFSGNLDMSFDIDDSPLPDFITDSDGNTLTKTFDHISVSTITVSENSFGKLSDDIPEFIVQLPGEEVEEDITGSRVSDADFTVTANDEDWEMDVDPSTGDPFVTNTFTNSLIPHSVGATMNPTQKDGSPLFDPKVSDTSQEDCQFSYNLGSISPLVFEWSATLDWNFVKAELRDAALFWVDPTFTSSEQALSITRPVGLSLNNRYIWSELTCIMDVWSSYTIDVLEDPTNIPQQNKPQEHYDNLSYVIVVDGFGGGGVNIETGELLPFDIFLIIFFIIAIVIGYYVIRALRRRSKRKKQQELLAARGFAGTGATQVFIVGDKAFTPVGNGEGIQTLRAVQPTSTQMTRKQRKKKKRQEDIFAGI